MSMGTSLKTEQVIGLTEPYVASVRTQKEKLLKTKIEPRYIKNLQLLEST